MSDNFENFAPGLTSPASHFASVTPHDTTPLTKSSRSLYIGGAGDVAVTSVEGDEEVFVGVVAGTILPIRVSHVRAVGTTATNILSLW